MAEDEGIQERDCILGIDNFPTRKSNNASGCHHRALTLKHHFEQFYENRKTLLKE
jgi:hypothetical protein